MKIQILTFAALLLTFDIHAKEEHREHGAHQHGSAELSVAFDGPTGHVEFKSPSDSIVGFEHSAKTPADLKTKELAFKKFEGNIAEMVSFEKSLDCKFKTEKLEMTADSARHSDTIANFSVKCLKSPAGTKLSFHFQKYFSKLKDIDAQILIDAVQKSAEIKANNTVIELK